MTQSTETKYITQRELATRWKVAISTLERYRATDQGPPWAKLGGNIRYALTDILQYEQTNRKGQPA
jgi:hypothetical protein